MDYTSNRPEHVKVGTIKTLVKEQKLFATLRSH